MKKNKIIISTKPLYIGGSCYILIPKREIVLNKDKKYSFEINISEDDI